MVNRSLRRAEGKRQGLTLVAPVTLVAPARGALVSNVVDAMLLDSQVKWIGIVYEATAAGVDRFTVTPYVVDPT